MNDLLLTLSQFPTQSLAHLESFACVGVGLRGAAEELEILLIQRAQHPQDPWSGQIGFPGGKKDGNETHLQTLSREWYEEMNCALPEGPLANLDDVQARKGGGLLSFYVRPTVFHCEQIPAGLANQEVQSAFYWPVRRLMSQKSQLEWETNNGSASLRLPAVDVGQEIPLWGLSYLMVEDLLERLLVIPDCRIQDLGHWRRLRKDRK